MIYNFLSKLGISVCVLISVISFQVMANSSEKNDTSALSVSNESLLSSIVYRVFQNYELKGLTSFSTLLTLSDDIPYAKVFFSNNTTAEVKITVRDKNLKDVTSVYIDKNSNGFCTWKGDGEYKIDIRVKNGTQNHNGILSTGTSDSEFKN